MSQPAADPRVERTRAAVLDASRDLLMEAGPDAVTHVLVAGRAGLSRTTVYNHYPTRGDLLRATIDHVGHPVPTELSGDFEADLRSFIADLVEDLAHDDRARAFITVMERSQHDPEIADVRNSIVCEAQQQFRTMIERAIADGAFRADADVDIAIATLMGAFLFRRFMADQPIDTPFAERVVADFLRCHRP